MSLLAHHHYMRARDQLLRALDVHRPGHFICLIGPSGVGKTTVRNGAMREAFGSPAFWGSGRIPALEISALLPSNAFFNSRQFVNDMLDELNAPRASWLFRAANLPPDVKADLEKAISDARETWVKLRPRALSESQAWTYFKRGVQARGCRYVSIEQATALLVNHRNKAPADHALHLMAMGEACGVMYILTGVHTITQLWDLHPELRRRVIKVWMPPYRDGNRKERAVFESIVQELGNKLDLGASALLHKSVADLFVATAGVVGELIRVLEQAKRERDSDGARRLLPHHLEAAFHNEVDHRGLWNDVRAFHRAMRPADIKEHVKRSSKHWAAELASNQRQDAEA